MLGRTSLWIVIVVIVVAGFAAAPAEAQILGPGAYGLGFFNYGQYGDAAYYRIPYYALYPPVYYSYPVARPYGYSPFAYPPGTITPEVIQKTAPVEYRNPFVPQQPKATSNLSAFSAPRMYYNPYVKGSGAETLAARSAETP
jgi:hypothetical protein